MERSADSEGVGRPIGRRSIRRRFGRSKLLEQERTARRPGPRDTFSVLPGHVLAQLNITPDSTLSPRRERHLSGLPPSRARLRHVLVRGHLRDLCCHSRHHWHRHLSDLPSNTMNQVVCTLQREPCDLYSALDRKCLLGIPARTYHSVLGWLGWHYTAAVGTLRVSAHYQHVPGVRLRARRPVPLSGSSPLGRRPLQHLPVAAAPECQSESPSQWHGAGGAGRTPGSAGRPVCTPPGPQCHCAQGLTHCQAPPVGPH